MTPASEITEKACVKCGEVKPLSEFSPQGPGQLNRKCKPCNAAASRAWYVANREQAIAASAQWREDNPEKWREIKHRWWVYKKYGITREQYDEMFAAQNGVCAICGTTDPSNGSRKRLFSCVDHDHKTGKVRGLLCSRCNLRVGWYEEDPAAVLRAVIEYLEVSL